MIKGRIKKWDSLNGWGFIEDYDGNDYFFHETGLSHEIYVKDGDKVEFKVVQGDRGDKAVDISIID